MLIVQPLPPPDPPQSVIVVTGNVLPDPAAERAYAVETIDRDELVNSPTRQLDEIIKSVAGQQLFRRSDSTSGHPTSQGVTLRALGGNASSRVLLLLDGFVGWPVSKRLQLFARGENLLDETVVAGLGDDGTVERATRRTLWIGLRLGSR